MFSDLLDNELGYPKDTGTDYRYNCPFCGSDKYKLYLRVAEGAMQNVWHCFRCGEAGNPITFVMKYFHVSYPEALDILETYDFNMDSANYEPKDESLTDEEYIILQIANRKKQQEEKPKIELVPPPLPPGFKLLQANMNNPEAYPFLSYAYSRGFTPEQLFMHNVGYVTSSKVDLPTGKSIYLKNHLVFLTHGDDGQMQYWNTRAIYKGEYVKSFNAPSNDGEYSKSTTIFNLNLAKNEEFVVLFEGVPDALTIGAPGVATFGKQVTDEQIDLLVSSVAPTKPIFIYLDKDAKDETKKLAERLYARHKMTFIVLSPTYDDANKLGRDRAWEIIMNHSVSADANGILQLIL